MVTNLLFFFETAKKVRGGKHVWVKDSNGEDRKNVLLGGTILNPSKGFGHLWAAQLVQYTPAVGCLIFRSFRVKANVAAAGTTIYINADGYSDVPEVGQYLMKAPASASTSGSYAKVTDVVFNKAENRFEVTISAAIGALTAGDILVEADAAADTGSTGSTTVLVPNPNTFVEADVDLLPTEGYGLDNANYSISTVYDKQAWIERMQPLPSYVLANNRSRIDGIFWI